MQDFSLFCLLLATRKILFHFFLSIQFTILPIVSLTFFHVAFSCDYSYFKLFLTEHNGSFIQSTLSFHGVSLSGCFVKNCKWEKLFIKIILSVATSFSATNTHTHTHIQSHALYLQLSKSKINFQKSAISLHIKFFAFSFP